MPRQPRNDPDGGIHHVANRGVDRGVVFPDDESRVDFGQRLVEIHELLGVEVLAYCLMDNHYHLVLRCPNGGLSTAMQRLSAVFTRHLNDRHGRDGPLFRGRFASRTITTDAYLVNAIRYVHRNALDLPGVDSVEQYRWSSHRAYLGHRRPAAWLRTDFVLGLFGDSRQFHSFVAQDGSGPEQTHGIIDPAATVDGIEFLLRSADHHRRVRAGDVRAVVFALIDARPDAPATLLFDRLGITSAGALRNAESRARSRLETAPHLRRIATDALELSTRRAASLSTGV